MTTSTSTSPADPEAAALDLLVQAAETATGSTAFRPVLQDLAGLLHAESALAGLGWPDARVVAGTVSFDACTADDPVRSLRARASAVRDGRGRHCIDPAGVAQALVIAADLLALL